VVFDDTLEPNATSTIAQGSVEQPGGKANLPRIKRQKSFIQAAPQVTSRYYLCTNRRECLLVEYPAGAESNSQCMTRVLWLYWYRNLHISLSCQDICFGEYSRQEVATVTQALLLRLPSDKLGCVCVTSSQIPCTRVRYSYNRNSAPSNQREMRAHS